MKIAYIIFDDIISAETLQDLLFDIKKSELIIKIFRSIDDAFVEMEKETPCVVFYKIESNSEAELERISKMINSDVPVILVTSEEEDTDHAILKNAFGYLDYPIKVSALKYLTNRLNQVKQDINTSCVNIIPFDKIANLQKNKLLISTLEKIQILPLMEIVLLNAESNYTKILLVSGEELLASKTLKYFEDILDDYGFLRVHKSHVVNISFVKDIY